MGVDHPVCRTQCQRSAGSATYGGSVAAAGILTQATGDLTKTTIDESLGALQSEGCVSWLLLDPDEFAGISDRLGYERLSVDDAWNSASSGSDTRQRAQMIRFSDHTYFALVPIIADV